MREVDIQNAIRLALGSRPDLRLFRAQVGSYRMLNQPEVIIKIGQPGQADLNGILANGLRLEIEVKRPGEKLRPDQEAWRDMILKYGGVHIVAHSVEEAITGVENALNR